MVDPKGVFLQNKLLLDVLLFFTPWANLWSSLSSQFNHQVHSSTRIAAAEQCNGSTHCFTSGLNCPSVHLEVGLFSRFWKSTDVQGPANLLAVLASEEAAQWEYISHRSTPSKFYTPAVVLGSSVCSFQSERNQLTNCLSPSFTFCCAFANLLYIFSWVKPLVLFFQQDLLLLLLLMCRESWCWHGLAPDISIVLLLC